MKNLAKIALPIMLLLASSFTCFAISSKTSDVRCFAISSKTSDVRSNDAENPERAEEPESGIITLDDGTKIAYSTTVTDLNTGAEYHTTYLTKINAKAGDRYAINVTARVINRDTSVKVVTYFSAEFNHITVQLDVGGDSPTSIFNRYSFAMPEETILKYDKNSLYSTGEGIRIKTWKRATGNAGLEHDIGICRTFDDGFEFEVADVYAIQQARVDIKIAIGIIILLFATIICIGFFPLD